MSLSDHQLKKHLGAKDKVIYIEKELQETIRKSRAAFEESEAEELISHAEFLYQQSRYIHKRWWILQGVLLFLLWLTLWLTESNVCIQRYMGIAASLFAVLLLPELWKNRNANALEIESVSYYSLRQIYSARIFAFALVDLLLLSVFTLMVMLTGEVFAEEMLIQFFLPYIVTCCICFRVLSSRRIGSEVFALFLCVVWCLIWTQIVSNEEIYGAVSMPVWFAMTAAAVFYLAYCVYRGQNNCTAMWEVNTLWM